MSHTILNKEEKTNHDMSIFARLYAKKAHSR